MPGLSELKIGSKPDQKGSFVYGENVVDCVFSVPRTFEVSRKYLNRVSSEKSKSVSKMCPF